MWSENFHICKTDLEKAEEPEIKLPTSVWSSKKQESSRKTSISALLTIPKPFCGSQQTRKFSTRWEYQTIWLASWEICMQVKKQQLEPDVEKWTGFKLGKKYIKAVYCHRAYLTYMQCTSCESPGWMSHKLESRLLGEISIMSDMQMIPPLWQEVKRNQKASRHKSREPRVSCSNSRKTSRVLLQRILRPDSPTMTRGQWRW